MAHLQYNAIEKILQGALENFTAVHRVCTVLMNALSMSTMQCRFATLALADYQFTMFQRKNNSKIELY